MTGHRTPIKGYKPNKDGKLVPTRKHLDVSKRIASRTKKTVKPVRKTER